MDRLGLIAGSGNLPLMVVEHCKNKKLELFTVLLENFPNKNEYNYNNCIVARFGQVGKIIKFFKKNNVDNVVFAGGVKKPSFSHIKFDFRGFLLLKSILKNKILGDNTVLETIIGFLKKYNIEILEIDNLLENIKFEKGFNTLTACNQEYLDDIKIGQKLLNNLSEFDIGQAVVVQQKNIIGIECFEGTASLIERCKNLKYNVGTKPVLIKMKKSNQTRKIDLPSIGVDTIIQLHESGFEGMAVDTNNCLVININRVIDLAKKYNLFIYGI